jgi:hypothetical protein
MKLLPLLFSTLLVSLAQAQTIVEVGGTGET